MFGSLEFVLDRGQIDDWFHSTTIIIFATISACSLIFFIPWELTRDDPIVDIRLLGRRQFGMAFIVMLAVGAMLFGSNQITPQLMQTNFPYTAMLSGLAMMPGGMAMLVMMPIIGQVARRVQPKYMIATGFTIIAAAMWYSTSLVPDASFSYFAMVRVFQTVGMPFMFIPINSVAYTGPAAAKNREGSALINVARNLGGSISVSLANTELVQRSQFHQARLVENLTQSSPTFQSTLHNLTQYFTQFGSPAGAQRPRAGLYRPAGQPIRPRCWLYRYILQLGGFRRRACADRSLVDPARWTGQRPSGGGTLTFLLVDRLPGNGRPHPGQCLWHAEENCGRGERSVRQSVGTAAALKQRETDVPSIKAKKQESGNVTRFRHQKSIVHRHYSCLSSIPLGSGGS